MSVLLYCMLPLHVGCIQAVPRPAIAPTLAVWFFFRFLIVLSDTNLSVKAAPHESARA
jgi:hypothetical protein